MSKNGEPKVTGLGAVLNKPISGVEENRGWERILDEASATTEKPIGESDEAKKLDAAIRAYNAAAGLKRK